MTLPLTRVGGYSNQWQRANQLDAYLTQYAPIAHTKQVPSLDELGRKGMDVETVITLIYLDHPPLFAHEELAGAWTLFPDLRGRIEEIAELQKR